MTQTDLDGFVRVSDESNEQTEHHVDEDRDEGVEVESAEEPHHVGLVSHLQKGGIHIVTVDEREEAVCHFVQSSELQSKVLMRISLFFFNISVNYARTDHL